jgi:hypothetical protein
LDAPVVQSQDAEATNRVHVETTGAGPEEIYAVDERT